MVKEYGNQKIVNTIGVNSKNNLTYSNNNCQMETFPRLSCSQVLSTLSSEVRGEWVNKCLWVPIRKYSNIYTGHFISNEILNHLWFLLTKKRQPLDWPLQNSGLMKSKVMRFTITFKVMISCSTKETSDCVHIQHPIYGRQIEAALKDLKLSMKMQICQLSSLSYN